MKTLSKSQFTKIINEHQKYLADPKTGKKAVFNNIEFENSDFEDRGEINLSGAEFENCDFSSVNTNDYGSTCEVDFSNCKIADCNFEDSAINGKFNGAKILNSDFNNADLDSASFDDDTEILNCEYDGENEDFISQQKESVKKLIEARDEFKQLQTQHEQLKQSQNVLTNVIPTSKQAELESANLAKALSETPIKHQESLPMSTQNNGNSEPTNIAKLPFWQMPSMNFIKNSIVAGVQITVGNKVSAMLDGHVMKALKTAGVPEKMLEHKIVKMLISIATPQVLRMLLPLLPKIASSDLAIKAIELACVSSATKMSDEALEYIISVVEPITNPFMKSLNSPSLKADLKKITTAEATG